MDTQEQVAARICVVLFTLSLMIVVGIAFVTCCTSCTMNFSNVSTNGRANDVVHDTDTVTPDVKSDFSIPASIIPKV